MEAAFCLEALEEAMAKHGRPEIFNTDQGSQFTSLEFTGVLTAAGVVINEWQGRLARQCLCRAAVANGQIRGGYLPAYDSVSQARASISKYLAFYNAGRPHSSLDERTPDEVYFGAQTMAAAA
jgi:putative transposase